MSRKDRHISEYETEIISMVNQELTLREIDNRLGFTHQPIRDLNRDITKNRE